MINGAQISRVTMATEEKKRSAYFSPAELDVLLQSYSEYEHIFQKKSNTAASARQRQLAWENIAAQVNACNPAGIKRTWQQLKMKYKNIIQSANRKKAEARKTGGGPAPPPLTTAEEMALSLNTGRPVAEGIPAGSSSEPVTPQDTSAFIRYAEGNIVLLEHPVTTEPQAVDVENDTLSADTDRPIESVEEQPPQEEEEQEVEGPSNSSARMNTLPVKELYRLHLIKKIEKTKKEMCYLDRQILKSDLEIEILKHKLQEIRKTK
ncbi:uncharacterized protein LOC144989335 isoform X2 [Oryzias latipes]